MTPSTPVQDLATQWSYARKLYPIYFELAREFAIDVKSHAELEAMVDTPGKETVEQANTWMIQSRCINSASSCRPVRWSIRKA
jgi:hypothetical protein